MTVWHKTQLVRARWTGHWPLGMLALLALGCGTTGPKADALLEDAPPSRDTMPDTTDRDAGGDGSALDLPPTDGAPNGWVLPRCTTPSGFPGIAFGPNEVSTVERANEAFAEGISYTMGLAALSASNVLVAQYTDAFYRSTDAGCTWKKIGASAHAPLRIAAGVGDRAWAWLDNATPQGGTVPLYRIDGAVVTQLSVPAASIIGLGTDPAEADRIRIGGKDGVLMESRDGGSLWRTLGTPASSGGVGYRVAFDPRDLDHLIYGRTSEGFHVSFDGAKSWTQSQGLSLEGKRANGMNAVISPADGKVVWAMGIDLDPIVTNQPKHIYHSADGGRTFTPVVTRGGTPPVTLTNGMHLVAHPRDRDILYFAFGTCVSGYGTDFYRFHKGSNALSTKNLPYPGFNEIVVSPASDSFIYLGVQGSTNPQCPKPTP